MKTRDEKISAEAAALWRELFGAAPPADADGVSLLGLITGKLPDVRYDRMRSPFLRPSLITRPRGEGETA
jgi:hypothetical protein